MKNHIRRTLTIILVFCAICLSLEGMVRATPLSRETRGTILFVKPGADGNCSDWDHACDLYDAMWSVGSGDEIWVAAGTYKLPIYDNRNLSYEIISGVAYYGGFPTDGGDWSERNPAVNPTILSGDIGVEDDTSDNSYHVVYAYNVAETTILDGFTITGGYADGLYPDNSGGGMYNFNSSPTVSNVTFSGNYGNLGGGFCNDQSNPTVTYVTFTANSAIIGGGMYNDQSSPTVTNVTFSANSVGYSGGGMFNVGDSTPILTNVTIYSNISAFVGGIHNENSHLTLINSIIWNNIVQIFIDTNSTSTVTYSNIEGGYTGEGNINAHPRLAPLAYNGGFTQTHAYDLYYRPGIDLGSPTVCPATDQRGFFRPTDGNGDGTPRCDMGAYEYKSFKPLFSFLPLIFR